MSPAQSSAPAHNYLGALYLSLAVLCFAAIDTLAKVLAPHYPVTSLVWMRFLVQTLLLALFVGPSMGWALVRTARPGPQIARALCLLGASLCIVAGVRHLPLAEVTAIQFLAPVTVCLLSVPMLGEKIGPRDWAAVIVGFFGVLVIVRPGGQVLSLAALLPLGAALCNSLYQVLTRQFSASEHPNTTTFITSLVGTVVMGASLPFAWVTPSLPHALLILGMGAAALTGHLLLTKAYQLGSPAVLAPYTYGHILWATVLGYLVFGVLPDAVSGLGMGIIAASGLYISYHRIATRKARP